MNGVRVGTWSLPARGPQEFSYSGAWLRSSQFRPLSLSLPAGLGATTLRGAAVESWFDNLLPDSNAIRRRAQGRFQAASTSAFDLLAARAGAQRHRSHRGQNSERPGDRPAPAHRHGRTSARIPGH